MLISSCYIRRGTHRMGADCIPKEYLRTQPRDGLSRRSRSRDIWVFVYTPYRPARLSVLPSWLLKTVRLPTSFRVHGKFMNPTFLRQTGPITSLGSLRQKCKRVAIAFNGHQTLDSAYQMSGEIAARTRRLTSKVSVGRVKKKALRYIGRD